MYHRIRWPKRGEQEVWTKEPIINELICFHAIEYSQTIPFESRDVRCGNQCS